GLPARRADQMLELVGLTSVAGKRAGGYSLGMSQRLGIAAAMLGDPRVLLLDEPVNGLDPEGVLWIRTLMKRLAAEGRTIFVSSHLMNEMAVTADHLIVIGRGRLIADASTTDVIERSTEKSVLVRSPQADQLAGLIVAAGGQVSRGGGAGSAGLGAGPASPVTDRAGSATGPAGPAAGADVLTVREVPAARIGEIAAAARIVLHELTPQRASLEAAFLELTSGSLEYGGGESDAGPTAPATGPEEQR
ncbi:MAG: ATP-binding cassette domain-containing protein, partial [Actinomycetota bacterium]|nr:ATP-binding cassette domain-containing protein [Actinomycetota bacterium]